MAYGPGITPKTVGMRTEELRYIEELAANQDRAVSWMLAFAIREWNEFHRTGVLEKARADAKAIKVLRS